MEIEPAEPVERVPLLCSDPLHATRKGQPGWADTLGEGTRAVDGMLCEACATDPTGATMLARAAKAAVDAADTSAEQFIRARIPGVVDKAKQIMANPGASTPTWTAAETRVILAALVLDLAARRTR